jgi:hypothetical protein
LRYDYDNLSKGGSDKGDYNNLAPRFNFNYKLTIQAVCVDTVSFVRKLYFVYSDALQQNTTSQSYKLELQKIKVGLCQLIPI